MIIDQQASRLWWSGINKQQQQTPTMPDTNHVSNNQWVRIYLVFDLINLSLQLQLQSNARLFVCFIPQQSIINTNNVKTSSINVFVTMISSLQIQLEQQRDSTMAMAIVTCIQQHSSRMCATSITTMTNAKYNMPDAHNSNNNTIFDAIHIHQLNPSTRTQTRGWYREEKDVRTIKRGEG